MALYCSIPQGQDQVSKVYAIAQVTCKKELSFRVSVANQGYLSGSVSYAQDYAGAVGTGLRVRYGC